MSGDADSAQDIPETDDLGPEDTLLDNQKGRIIIAVILLGCLIFLVVFVNVPAIRASAGMTLTKNTWQLVSYADATGVTMPALSDPVITAQFRKDGAIAGSAGCNHYGASFTTSDYTIQVTTISHTEVACSSPGVMAQEVAYLDDLASSTEFRVTDTALRMYGPQGEPLLVFVPVP